MTSQKGWVLIVAAVLLLAGSTPAQTPAAAADHKLAAPGAAPEYAATGALAGHLEIGTRSTMFSLLEPKRTGAKGFLGRIRKLEENQDYLPIKLFATWMFNPNWGLELSWDKMEIDTFNRADGSYTTFVSGDGDLTVNNYFLTFIGRFPNSTIFTPYGGIGAAYMTGSFDEYDWWYYNYDSAAAYESFGSPHEGRNGYTRDITVDSGIGYLGVIGTGIAVSDAWTVDLCARLLIGTLDSEFQKNRHGARDSGDLGEFQLDSVSLGAGIRYAF